MSVANPWFLSELAAGAVAVLLGLSALALLIAPRRGGSQLIYGGCAIVSAVLATATLAALLTPGRRFAAIQLAVGLPQGHSLLGFDSLSAAFAVIINVAISIVSGYAIGYGAHAREPRRVLPFYAAFIAGMNLVLLARDAFSFLVGWELMSLTSWALVLSYHTAAENRRWRCCSPSDCSPAQAAVMPSTRCGTHPLQSPLRWCSHSRSSGQAPRRGWCRCTPGYRWRTPRPRATCRR